jgi:hypothetical protein
MRIHDFVLLEPRVVRVILDIMPGSKMRGMFNCLKPGASNLDRHFLDKESESDFIHLGISSYLHGERMIVHC